MTKKIMYATWSILGASAIAGAAVSGVYISKYNNLNEGLNFEGKLIKINMFDSTTDTMPVTKIYEVQENEKTLEDLMLDHQDDFKLSAPSSFGRMVNSIYGIEALYKNGFWWQLASPTYAIEHPEKRNGIANQTTMEYALNVGVSGVILNNSEIINFYKTPSGN